MATKKEVRTTEEKVDVKSLLEDNKMEIGGKIYLLTYNWGVMNALEKTGFNLMAEVANAPNGFIPLVKLKDLFCAGILAGESEKTKLFEKALEERGGYYILVNEVFEILKNQMGFLFPGN